MVADSHTHTGRQCDGGDSRLRRRISVLLGFDRSSNVPGVTAGPIVSGRFAGLLHLEPNTGKVARSVALKRASDFTLQPLRDFAGPVMVSGAGVRRYRAAGSVVFTGRWVGPHNVEGHIVQRILL